MQKIAFLLYFLTLKSVAVSYSVTDIVYKSCMNVTAVKNGSFYTNLHTVVQSLVRNVDFTHFNYTRDGQGNDAVYGMLQCRGGLSPSECQHCTSVIAQKIDGLCSTVSAVLQLNGCILRYANYDFISTDWDSQFVNITCDARQQTRNPDHFKAAVSGILYDVTAKANNNSGFAVLSDEEDSTQIYALAQCWGSLQETSCGSCFTYASPRTVAECDNGGAIGGQFISAGCYLRYDTEPFFNTSLLSQQGSIPGTAEAPHAKAKNSSKLAIILGGVTTASLVVVLCIIIWKCLQRRHRRIPESGDENYDEGGSSAISLSALQLNFNYEVLRNATRNFDMDYKLGEGGFGSVYKGTLPDGRVVAVKRLMMISRQGNNEFVNEVNLISSVQHRNLVKLLGCCVKGAERLLVYEYLPNKSLDRFLFDTERSHLLDWQKRFNIILGTARGLAYLHEESHIKIVHRDIKASNILLDENLMPKIADFGLARLLSEEQSHITTRVAGTLGYMAPEYAFHGQLTEKADIYSFGVLTLEIVSGRRNKDVKPEEDYQSLIEKTWKLHKSDKIFEIIDLNLGINSQKSEVIRVIHVALLCTQAAAKQRPSMSGVVNMLKSKQVNLLEPSDPAFVDLKRKGITAHHTPQSSGLSTILPPSSASSSFAFSSSAASSSYTATDTSVSVLEPR